MEWKLEVVSDPITDVDRAKDFYAGKMGFNLDHDSRVDPRRAWSRCLTRVCFVRAVREKSSTTSDSFSLAIRPATAGHCSRYLPAAS